jgi:catechol 2,3-dioxygenase-like lactoylglutathione lyase family enzyme
MRILESALYVEDVSKSADFYGRLFGFRRLMSSERFCALDVAPGQVLLLFRKRATTEPFLLPNGEVIPPHDGEGNLHFAFGVEREELADWERRIADAGIAIESRVHWALGGESIYFRDPDGHLAEIATRGTWANF